ncbi:chorismate mutase AroH [bacterium BMS3Abin05]|nr:chorismate mutase AroH [bacterium BMS3Abin05]GBE26575.1 chorismate mutase AroH [bacterium BMS3Bbin03]
MTGTETKMVRGIRGAIDTPENTEKAILDSSEKLLRKMLELNQIETEAIAAIFFSLTPDLNATFPAKAARRMGLINVPLLHMQEIAVPEMMQRVIRILILANLNSDQRDIRHVYLENARQLRPDIAWEEEK